MNTALPQTLTTRQHQLLDDLARSGPKAVAPFFPTAKYLVKTGLAYWDEATRAPKLTITDAGKEFLKAPKLRD